MPQCKGVEEVLARYQEVVPQLFLSGPTSFAPIVRAAMRAVSETGGAYHILLLLADGQVTPANMPETVDAIVAASKLPLSIVMVGVGDGPWDDMHRFDDQLPERIFDNFQFVEFSLLAQRLKEGASRDAVEAEFALAALMEVPEQVAAIERLGLVGKKADVKKLPAPLPPPPHVKG